MLDNPRGFSVFKILLLEHFFYQDVLGFEDGGYLLFCLFVADY
jgi:hypothetical protein